MIRISHRSVNTAYPDASPDPHRPATARTTDPPDDHPVTNRPDRNPDGTRAAQARQRARRGTPCLIARAASAADAPRLRT